MRETIKLSLVIEKNDDHYDGSYSSSIENYSID